MSSWTSNFFSAAKGTKLHYYRTGGDKPSLILLHGITDDSLCWSALAKDLEADYDVIMLDLRAHGKSDAPDDGYDFKTIADEVADLIMGLGLKNPIVMGHSLGAMTALSVGAYHPDLPCALVLEDPPPFWGKQTPSQGDFAHRAGMAAWFRHVKRCTQSELLAEVRAQSPSWAEAELLPWADAKHRFSPKIDQMLDPQKTVAGDFSTRIGDIGCPTLLFSGDPAQGAIIKPKDASDLAAVIPQLQHTNIPNVGHNIRREAYPTYLKVLRTFLEQLD